MLSSALKKYAPAWCYGLLQKVYKQFWDKPPLLHTLRGDSPVELVPFDRLYEDIEKQYHVERQTVRTPEVPAMSLVERAAHLHGDTYTIPEDFVVTLHDVFYSPTNNVVLAPSRKIIAETLNTGFMELLEQRELYLRRTHTIPGYCTLLRSRFNNYYHTLIDNIPRLLALDRRPYTELDEIKLLCPGGLTDIETFYLSRVAPANARVVEPKEHRLYRAEHLLFTPFKTRRFAGYIPAHYVEQLRARLLPNRPSTRAHRLFISREGAGKRVMENQSALMTVLTDHGFQKVAPEELTPQQQIELFYDAEAVVGSHGAGLSNVLFSRCLKVIELFPSWYVVPHYYYLSKSLGHDYAYWCGSKDSQHANTFTVDVPAVRAMLARMGIS